MFLNRLAFRLPAAALLAASFAVTSWGRSTTNVPTLKLEIVAENALAPAEDFLADKEAQDTVKASDEPGYFLIFQRAAELADLKGVVAGSADAHSIRLSLLQRTSCSFCLDPVAFPAWITKNLGAPGQGKLAAVDEAMWIWAKLTASQKAWVAVKKKDAAWPKLGFVERHGLMRDWALAERAALLKLNPAEAAGTADFRSRAYYASQALGSHEMTKVWERSEKLNRAAQSLAAARARVAMGNDPRQKALLAQAVNAATPEARLAALAQIFENYGERPAALLAAAPPRADQTFTPDSRKLVADMLKTAMLRETEGTFAGDDLKEFYKKTPLVVTFTTTSLSALGWYEHGGNTLYFNERYVEEYVKTHGKSIENLKRDPELMQNLARIFAATFVHEAQHHRQDAWARENKVPRTYHQGDEVEAFQTDALFMMQKLRDDKRFRDWAAKESQTSSVVAGDIAMAQRMEEEGPGYFERKIPNTHYPEVLSNEGHAWCQILWHNFVEGPIGTELMRRSRLTPAARGPLESSTKPVKPSYATAEAFRVDLLTVSSKALRANLADAKTAAENAAKFYNQIRIRQEAAAAVTMDRYTKLEPRDGPRTQRAPRGVPSPVVDTEK